MDTPLDPAQRKGGRMKLNPVPHLATARGWAYRILTAKTPAERVDFRSKTASFHSKFDHSLVKIERGTGGGYLLEKKFLSVGRGGCYGILSENKENTFAHFSPLKAGSG